MAEISYVRTPGDGRSFHYVWTALGNDDTGQVVHHAGAADMSFQVFGTFGSATIIFQGSNQPLTGTIDTYWTLTDQADNALSFTAAGGEAVAPIAGTYRPSTSGGSGTAITAILFVRSTMR